MLHPRQQGLRRQRPRDLPNRLRDLLHHQVRGQAERNEARGQHELRKNSGQNLRTRMLNHRRRRGVSRQRDRLCHHRAGGSLRSQSA